MAAASTASNTTAGAGNDDPTTVQSWFRRLVGDGGGVLVVLLGVVAVSFVVLVVRAATWRFVPTSDRALIGLHALEVGGSHNPFVGPYSRFGWSHPGPVLYWAGAVGEHLAGHAGLMAAAAFVNGLAVAAATAVAWRWSRVVAALVALVGMWAVLADGGTTFADIWNPHVIPLAVFACLVACWGASLGSGAALVVAVVAGSWAVQTHVGSAPVVAAGLVAGLIWRVAVIRRRDEARIGRRGLTAAAVSLFVLWLAPIWQELRGKSGNLTLLWHFWFGNRATVGLSKAAPLFFREFSVPPPWALVRHDVPVNALVRAHSLPAALLLAGTVLVGLHALSRRRFAAAGLAWTAVVAAVASLFAIAGVVDEPYEYVIHWIWATSMLVWVAFLYGLGLAVSDLVRWVRPRAMRFAQSAAVAVLVAATIVVGAGASYRALDARPPRHVGAGAAESLIHQLKPRLDRALSYRMVWNDRFMFGQTGVGVATQLIEDGRRIYVRRDQAVAFGHERTVADRRPLPTVVITATWDPTLPAVPAGAALLATFDPLTPTELVAYGQLYRRVVAAQLAKTPDPFIDVTGPLTQYGAMFNGAAQSDVLRLHALQLTAGQRFIAWLIPAAGLPVPPP